MDQSPISKKRQLIATLAVLIVIVVIVTAVAVTKKDKTTNADSAVTTSDTSTSDTASTSSNSTLKDGSYKATGSYASPGGEEEITVSVTLKDGVITETSAKSGANGPEAQEYQDQFIAGYKSQVVGKNISEIHLSRVSGSSLTSQGFNDAIQQIESQAQA